MVKNIVIKLRYQLFVFKNNFLPKFFILSPHTSAFYYLFFSNKFKREQYSVLNGKVKHLKETKNEKSNVYTLVRNTHRIEKGLLMRPRREVFALDYIVETVDVFCEIWTCEKANKDLQFKWFYDVLEEYFTVSGNHDLITKQASRFYQKTKNCNSVQNGERKNKLIPYYREHAINKPKISFEDFYTLTRYRRSVRWFLNKKVPIDLVKKAILAANQSPSACNRQPFDFHVIDEVELLKKVVELPGGVRGYEDGIPMMIVVRGNLDAYFDERDRHIIYIDASLASMSFMLALETLGLSSCAINWPDVEYLEKKMERILNLQKHQRVIMCIAVGYPDPNGQVASSAKKNIENIIMYN